MKNSFPRATAGAFLTAAILIFAAPLSLRGQMGNDNPTGISGVYNGNVNTAGSYDPYTGNATRSVTDIAVAGAVGAYPLAFTRTMNSRYTSGAMHPEFGPSGNWRHSYQWSIEPVVFQSNDANTKWTANPGAYTVNYPDGRELSFSAASGDPYFRGGPGISDRLQQLSGPGGGDCFLLLPDGGKVWFQAEVDREVVDGTQTVTSTFTFQLMGIIDPYGQLTTITYPGDGSMQITEPAGRWLKLFYITTSWLGDTVLVSVQASDGRSVTYGYGGYQPAGATMYTYLGNVQYRDSAGASYAQAIYCYQPNNVVSNGRPLIYWAIDPMYTGPMWAISYTFVPYSAGGVYGQLQSENYLDPATGTPGQVVSSLSASGNSRTETRGDGPSRTFNYSGGKLASYTDFKGQPSGISYDANGFVWSFTDAGGHTTTTAREGIIGAVIILTHPDQDRSTQGHVYWYSNGGPYYEQIRGDEGGHNTYFIRDQNNFQLTQIYYPNGAYEEFTYDPYGFGKVATHKRSSGGAQGFATDTFSYDGRGMMWSSSNADGTTYYYYDAQDRLEHLVDPRGKPTWYQYNPRGQLTRVTHVDGSYSQYGYNGNGTLAWTADENHPGAENDVNQRTRYGYDDYKRMVSVTNPLTQTASFVYAQDWSNAYNQTTANLKGAFSPMGKAVHFAYDENWQRTIMRIPPGVDPNDAWTFYGYDAAGNLAWTQDPRGYTTAFDYDERNRRIWMDDPIASDRNNRGHTMNWDYDATSNLRFQTRADSAQCEWRYDSMNRMIDTYGFANEHTHYDRDLAGNVYQMIDAKNAVYGFGYDAMNRKISAAYPPDASNASRTETWHYDAAGNVDLYKNPADTYRHLFYDDRNRMYDAWWDNYAAPEVVIGYDAASRVSSVVTNTAQITGETIVTFGYDDADRKIWEDQTLAGYPTRHVTTSRDADGNRQDLGVAGTYQIYFDYTQRGQLLNVYGGGHSPLIGFSYDEAGNLRRVEGQSLHNFSGYEYDGLNRVSLCQQAGANGGVFESTQYQYDNVSRETARWRNEAGVTGVKGERFGYNAMNQLTSASYDADQVWTGNPQNATLTQSYDVTPLNRNAVWNNGLGTSYSFNALNQYTSVNGTAYNYDGNFNLASAPNWSGAYDAQSHLVSAGHDGNVVFLTYDGLGRCVRRIAYRPDGNSTTLLFTYDGWNPIVEWDGAGNLMAHNVYGPKADQILFTYRPNQGTVLWYHLDEHNNVVALLDGASNGLEKYVYDAFGQPTIIGFWDPDRVPRATSWYGNRFMFQGREYLSELGIYDYRNRMYLPSIGRFLQSDPLGFGGGDANLFRYCGGDPVNRGDPFGLQMVGGGGGEIPLQNSGNLIGDPDGQHTFYAGLSDGVEGDEGVNGSSSSGIGLNGPPISLSLGGVRSGGGPIGSVDGGVGTPSYSPAINGMGALGSVDHGGDGGFSGRITSSIVNWARGVASAATMFGEFVSNSGPQVRVYGPDSVESADLRSDPMLLLYAAEAYADPNGVSSVRQFPFPMGPIEASYHPTRQFVGSYTVEIRNGQAVVMNRTSLWSAAAHLNFVPAPDRTQIPFGGNTYQAYIIGPYP